MKYFEYIPGGNDNPNSVYIYNSRLNNQPITGFYNIDDNGNAWQGKYEQIYSVECVDVIEDALNHTSYYKDRIPDDILELPYKLNEILVDVNSPVKASIYNDAIKKIYNNMLYIYSNCFIPNNYIPYKIENWAGRKRTNFKPEINDDDSKFEWNGYNEQSVPMNFDYRENTSDIIDIRLINNIRESVVFVSDTYSYMFAITTLDVNTPMTSAPYSNRLICLRTNIQTRELKLILNTQFIDDDANQDINTINENGERVDELDYVNNLTFGSLNSITSDDKRFIYILDGSNNHIYAYDVFNIINEDKLFKNRLLLTNIFGDQDAMGNINYKFIKPTLIRFVNNQLIIFDVGDDSIKIFDKTFNWLGTMNNRNFQSNIPQDIIYSQIQNEYYLLTRDAYILRYNSEFRLLEKIFSGIYLDNDEFCHKFYISYNNCNICYVLTNNRIFKKFVTKLNKNIGSFLFHRYQVVRPQKDIWNLLNINWDLDMYPWEQWKDDLSNDYYDVNVKCLSIIPKHDKFDHIYVIINSRILYCIDDISYNTLIANDNNYILNYYSDFDLYKLDDIYMKDEYVQSLTYNKSLYKLVYNLNYLASKIIFKPTMAYDNYTNILIKDLQYINNELLDPENIKIYDNENVDVCVINRIINRLYDFEVKILNNIQTNIINTKKSIDTRMYLL